MASVRCLLSCKTPRIPTTKDDCAGCYCTAYAAQVKDCTFVGNGMGINFKGSGVTITGCTGRIVRNTPHPHKDDWGALGINLQQIAGHPLR